MLNLAEELHKFNPWWEEAYQPDFVPRPEYAKLLAQYQTNRDIVILTGIRRAGKTTLMKLEISRVLKTLEPRFILYASLDSIALEKFSVGDLLREYRKLHGLKLKERVFLFFDEVAYRPKIHQELKNLYDAENVKIFASASSASILRDTRGFLTGRARVLEVLPLDFTEYLAFKKVQPLKSERYLLEKHFEEYLRTGGIPEFVLTGDVSYLDNLIESVIHKDIIAFHGVRDVTGVKDFFRLLMERAGKQFTINKSAKIFGVSPDTMRRYLEFFTQTYLVYTIERCGKLNERLRSPKKLYAADIGIRNHMTGFRDKGAIFENLVFLKIKHKNPCYVQQNGAEIDFFAGGTLMEVKLDSDLAPQQRALFDSFKAKEKRVIRGMDDYMSL
jgi:predicted AAA+ superfamily ATPase